MVSARFSSGVALRDLDAPPSVSRDGDRTVVWLDGEHDIATVLDLAETLAGAISLDDADVIVDLSGVTFMGAATLDEFVRVRNTMNRQSRNLTLRSPSRCARRVLDICGLSGFVEAGETESPGTKPGLSFLAEPAR